MRVRNMLPIRLKCRATASRILHRAIRLTTYAAIGAALNISDVSVVRWCDEDAGEAMTIGDLVCCYERGETAFARRVVELMSDLFDRDPGPALEPVQIALEMVAATGKLAQIAATVKPGEALAPGDHQAFLDHLREIEASLHQMRSALEKA
jgi:hypothetical protein